MKVHHIGYLVKNINKSIAAFRTLGFRVTIEASRDAHLSFLEKDEYFNIRENSSYQYTNEDFDIILKDNNYVLFNDLDNLFLHKNY